VILSGKEKDKAPEHRFAPLINGIIGNLGIKNLLVYGDDSFLVDLKADHKITIQKHTPGFDLGEPVPCEMSVHLGLDAESLDELRKLTTVVGFFVVKDQSRPNSWWLRKMIEDWNVQNFQVLDDSFYCIVYPDA